MSKFEHKRTEDTNLLVLSLKEGCNRYEEHVIKCNNYEEEIANTLPDGKIEYEIIRPLKVTFPRLFKRAYWPEICTDEELNTKHQISVKKSGFVR